MWHFTVLLKPAIKSFRLFVYTCYPLHLNRLVDVKQQSFLKNLGTEPIYTIWSDVKPREIKFPNWRYIILYLFHSDFINIILFRL